MIWGCPYDYGPPPPHECGQFHHRRHLTRTGSQEETALEVYPGYVSVERMGLVGEVDALPKKLILQNLSENPLVISAGTPTNFS